MQLADDSDEVPNLQDKTYAAFKLLVSEWTKMELMRDVLQVWKSFLGPLLHIIITFFIVGACQRSTNTLSHS
jgi:hypothetical protein